MIFVNEFLQDLAVIEKEIILERFGGNDEERILKFEEIGKKHQITKESTYQKYAKVIEKLKVIIGCSTDSLIEKLKNDCIESVSPLTPQFLVLLTNNEYSLFSYPPAFYIRLISILSNEIPTLTEVDNKISNLVKEGAKMANQIQLLLKNSSLPISLPVVFNQVMPSARLDNSTKIFFEAIRSSKFNIIKGDNPNELFIELS